MAAERWAHLARLESSSDIEQQKKHATIMVWIGQFMERNGGIVESLKEERRAMLEQQSAEAEIQGSHYMEPDSGAFDED
jgi:hypothetical protein